MDIESGEVDIESTKVDIERVLMPFAKMPKTNRRTVKAVKNDTACGDGSTAFPQKARRTYQRKS